MAPPPSPNTQQDFFPTSARIEEVPPVSSGRSSRSGSHSAPQRNANNSHRRSYQFSQSQVPRNTNGSYEQFPNDNAPVHTTTFISNDVGSLKHFSGNDLTRESFKSSIPGGHLCDKVTMLLPRPSTSLLHLFNNPRPQVSFSRSPAAIDSSTNYSCPPTCASMATSKPGSFSVFPHFLKSRSCSQCPPAAIHSRTKSVDCAIRFCERTHSFPGGDGSPQSFVLFAH